MEPEPEPEPQPQPQPQQPQPTQQRRPRWPRRAAAGVQKFWRRLTLPEISGAMGDLGTYIPIVVALSVQ